MEAKYLFVILNLVLTFGLVSVLGESSRKEILANWSERRCDFDVLLMSFMYKPDGDTRTASEFSSDNLNFCISSKSTKYLETLFASLFSVLKVQMGASDIMTQVFKTLRSQLNTIYEPFAAMMNRFYTKFKQIGGLSSRIFQHLYMSMKKAAATAIASIFVALSIQTAFLNTIDLVIKVIMVVLYILLGLLFVFFLPILPFLVIVLITVAGIENAMPGSTGPMGSIFCFAKDTNVITKNGLRHMCSLKPGDILQGDNVVQGVVEVPGEQLYNLDSVLVSGYHCVYHNDEVIYVKDHPRSRLSEVKDNTLWTLITSKREIPIMGVKGPLRFLDWEEVPDNREAEKAWDFVADGILNGGRHINTMVPSSAPCLDPKMSVYTYQGGWRPMKDIKIGDWIRDSEVWTKVLGISQRTVDTAIGKEGDRITDGNWTQSFSDDSDKTWLHPVGEIENVSWTGLQFITDSGSFIIRLNSRALLVVRDFTEVGSENILESHTRVERLLEKPQALGERLLEKPQALGERLLQP